MTMVSFDSDFTSVAVVPQVGDSAASMEIGSLVLLAVPEEASRGRLASTIRGVGYGVLEVSTRAALLAELSRRLEFGRLRRPPVDLLVLDDRLPDGSGVDAVRVLRRRGWATPVIIAHADPRPAVRAEIRRLGSVALLDDFDDPDLVLDYGHYLAPCSWRKVHRRASAAASHLQRGRMCDGGRLL